MAVPLTVTVTLKEVTPEIAIPSLFPTRTLVLSEPDWAVKIGRSTTSGTGPRQADENAWYSSRVVSRDHAELRADPNTRELLIRDSGSMHGTHIFGRRLKRGVSERLYGGERIVFGAEVARGTDTFLPLEVAVSFAWSDGVNATEGSDSAMNSSGVRNYFTVDYSDDDIESQSSMISNGDISQPLPRYFAVPESDLSDEIISIVSDDGPHSDEESPTSSPLALSSYEAGCKDNKENQHLLRGARPRGLSLGSDDRLSPSLGDSVADDEHPDQDSYYEDSDIFDEDAGKGQPMSSAPAVSSNQHPQGSVGASQSGLLAVPVARPNRDPSPSDAAMVKPAVLRCPPFETTLPPIHPVPSFFAPQNQGLPQPPPNPFERNASAWAGHNSILYDAFSPCVIETGVPNDPFDRHEAANSAGESGQFPGLSASLSNFDALGGTAIGLHTESGLVTAPPLDVMPNAGQKRKADLISDDIVLVEDSIKEPTAQAAQAITPATIDFADLQPNVVTETIESLKSPPTVPARKKLKKHKHDSGARQPGKRSTFAKYAAAAMAGAAVGAIGTIWGLVTLPKDFFV